MDKKKKKLLNNILVILLLIDILNSLVFGDFGLYGYQAILIYGLGMFDNIYRLINILTLIILNVFIPTKEETEEEGFVSPVNATSLILFYLIYLLLGVPMYLYVGLGTFFGFGVSCILSVKIAIILIGYFAVGIGTPLYIDKKYKKLIQEKANQKEEAEPIDEKKEE